MKTISTDRMISGVESDASAGRVVWKPAKSVWTLALAAIAVIGGPLTFSWDGLLLFIATTGVTICAGHSVGMHRLLIHRSFKAPLWLERTLVYLGTLVGMAGPFGMIAAHDIRDWAQRQTDCHDLYAHRKGFFRDMWWQMHCVVDLENPPRFVIEPEVQGDIFYRFLERTWMLQQLPWAVAFYAIGGLPWVIWGIAVRVTLSLHGHWLIGHFAHRKGRQNWAVDGVAVQGFNIPHVSLLTFGESHHGNHHAFPGSARLGLAKGELDPGWWLIKTLEFLGLAQDVKQPADVGERDGLVKVNAERRYPKKLQLFAAYLTSIIVGMLTMYAVDTPVTSGVIWESVAGTFRFVAIFALIAFCLFVVPATRWKLSTASADVDKGFHFYMETGATLAVVISFLFLFMAPLVFLLVLPAALSASAVFAYLNMRAIQNALSTA